MAEVEGATAPVDDIRSAIDAAVTEHETVAAAPIKTEAKEPVAEKPAKADADGATGRDKDGKFAKAAAKAEDDDAGTSAETVAEKPEATDAEKPEGEESPAADEVPAQFKQALSAWKPTDQAMFKKLDPATQEFVMRRYKDMETDYTKKLQGIARLKTEYEPVDNLFAPHREVMKAKGLTPASLVEAWSNVEKKLVSGEAGALEVITGLVRGYNVPIDKVASALGLRAGATETRPAQQPGAKPEAPRIELPPELTKTITELQQQVTGLTSAQQQAAARMREAAAHNAETAAQQFRSATNDKGTLLHPYVDEVESDMLALALAAQQARQPVPAIEELYEKAIWANPSIRAKLRTAETQAAEQKRVDLEKTKAAAARKASGSVTGAPGAGQAPAIRNQPERSLRDELEANLADLSA